MANQSRLQELEQWLEDHKGETIYGGWRGDEPNEAWKILTEWESLGGKE